MSAAPATAPQPTAARAKHPVVAIAGNPNSGKTTLFNRLTGLRQRVGNYPGVTIERKTGDATLPGGTHVELVDIPGTYSLVARSREEGIAFDVITGRHSAPPDLVLIVLDASNLERNLYFALQILELGRPAMIVLNMIDVADSLGLAIDASVLSQALGVPVVPVSASKGTNIDTLTATLARALSSNSRPAPRTWRVDDDGERVLGELVTRLGERASLGEATWLLATVAASRDAGTRGTADDPLRAQPALQVVAGELDQKLSNGASALPAAVIEARYQTITELSARAVKQARPRTRTLTDRIDAVLLHRALGPLVLVLVLGVVFQAIFTWAEPLMDFIESSFALLGAGAAERMPEGPLRELVVNGVIAGVGSVLVFIPQIALLFLLLGLLEDSGYLARAAYMMDRLMARVGLHGRAFVPLLSGFACAIPAIMATRTIESPKDRLVTILVTPLASCSARLPVYALVISALFGGQTVLGFLEVGTLLLLAMYALSILGAVGMAALFKRTLLKSPTPPLVLELPPYKAPRLRDVLRRVGERCVVFVKDAGSIILAVTIILWALLSYPKDLPLSFDAPARRASIEATVPEGEARTAALAEVDAAETSERLQHTWGARAGRAIEPIIEPLGFDWRIGIGLIASLAAREVIVSTLGLVFALGDADADSEALRSVVARNYTPLTGLSLMIFFLFAAQCMSTLAIVRRETGSWRWPAFMFGYMTVLAYVASLITYQGGRLLGF